MKALKLGKKVLTGFIRRRYISATAANAYSGRRLPGLHDEKPAREFFWNELQSMRRVPKRLPDHEIALRCPRQSDILIIGGGVIGNAVAHFIKHFHAMDDHTSVTIIERDPMFQKASSVLSAGGSRQQFSVRENIEMAKFSSNFLRNIEQHLGVVGCDPPDIGYQPGGYLILASEAGVDNLKENHKTQIEFGAKVKLLSPSKLKEKFPWINTDGVAMASYGLENEGWFDSWSLLTAFRVKNRSRDVRYVNGEVVAFNFEHNFQTVEKLKSVDVRLPNGDIQSVHFAHCINCAGPWAGEIGKLLGMGNPKHTLVESSSMPLPVEPRKRYVYIIHAPDGPGLETPFLIDNTGAYVRRDGFAGHYICGQSPCEDEEPACTDLENVDYDWFYERVWPLIAHRVPSLSNAKYYSEFQLTSSWAGFYDYNYIDQNLIIGTHPTYKNFWFCNGLSGHGIQLAPAVGRAMAELIVGHEYTSIDLTRFEFSRFLYDSPIFEKCVI